MAKPRRYARVIPTPFGAMEIAVNEDGVLCRVSLPNRGPFAEETYEASDAIARGLDAARRQLDEYFAGRRKRFDLALDPPGSPFERAVWERLQSIPYGSTTSYGAIADELELKNGSRAVGRANGANPIPIVIPCHRVIGADGTLTGFGGGLELKRALLQLEGALAPSLF